MSKSVGAPAQYKQPSRKGKKAWRKNVDITEVQSGLEALREEIIQGGPVSEKPSDELFALDAVGSEEIKTKYRLKKSLKVDEILARRSLIPAVDSRKRGRLGDGIVENPNKRMKADWVSKKEVARLRKVADRTSHLNSEHVNENGTEFDLWGPVTQPNEHEESAEYVPKPSTKVAPATIKQAPRPMTANGRPSKAVQKPKAGTSYNPVFEDWDELLNRAGAEEVVAERTRLEQERLDAERQARIDAAATEDTGARTDNESEWEGFDTEVSETEMLKQKRPKRKTPAERNKIKRRKEAEQQTKHEQRMADGQKRVEETIQALITATQNNQDLTTLEEAEHSSGDDTKLRRRKLGNQIIPQKNLELVLPDELQESLRQLKPEGNLLQDRFRNLLVNGKIESRKPVLQPKKKKTKVTEKWSYKDFSVTV